MTKALETLERLREGNARFRECAERRDLDNDARAALANGQSPSAVIIGCADSRVSPELAFNQGLGELFVIRIAGHVIAAAALESVELAVEQLGAKLVVVLGHTGCAAVGATLAEVQTPGTPAAEKLSAVIHHIKPPIEAVCSLHPDADQGELIHECVRANVRHAAEQLRSDSAAISALVESGEVLVVGAEYCLQSGAVDFFDGAPA